MSDSPTSTSNHWNAIFDKKSDQQLGWFEQDVNQTLSFLNDVSMTKDTTIFIPGAGTSQLVDVLLPHAGRIIANDISNEALAQLANRVNNDKLTTLHHNMAKTITLAHKVDLWIDRAVLHFLLSDDDINGYFANLKNNVISGGYVLLAEFSTTGAKKCAGLPVHQYNIAEMQQRLGNDFTLIRHEDYTFINPFNEPKPYIYGLFKRK